MLKAIASLSAYVLWYTDAGCLPNAESPTRKLTIDGQELPLGIWVLEWTSARLAANVVRILAEDILGYQIVLGFGSQSSTAISALAGCMANEDCLEDGSKFEPARRYHIAMESWKSAGLAYERWKKLRPAKAPIRFADIGYPGTENTGITSQIVAKGMEKLGASLNVYSFYNVSLYDPSEFFTDISEINTSMLASCDGDNVNWRVTSAERGFDRYAAIFPDDRDGYFIETTGDKSYTLPRCPDGKWWLAPACRRNPSKCVPWITYSTWRALEHMQAAAMYNMPLAVGFAATMQTYAHIPRRYEVLSYIFQPDTSFVDIDMQTLIFPVDDQDKFKDTWSSRGTFPQVLDKWAAVGLQEAELLQITERLRITPTAMQGMLSEVTVGDEYKVVCDWLRKDHLPWRDWVPKATECVEGQGWADAEGHPVAALQNAKKCIWCQPGFISLYASGTDGFLCMPCRPGMFSGTTGNAACEECDVGRFSSTDAQTACTQCTAGTYASSLGASECTSCPTGFVTDGQGQSNASACVCEKSYYPSESDGGKRCVSCGWLYTTKTLGAGSPAECEVSMERFMQAGILLFAMFCLSLATLAAFCLRRYKRSLQQQQEDAAMVKILKQGFRSISTPQHPMCVMPMLCFCDLDMDEVATCHEGARDSGRLLVLDTEQQMDEFQDLDRKILFFSYSWTSWQRLGPNRIQLECMKASARRIQEMSDIDPEHLYIWLDILSIPQASDRCKELAVDSLYVYASRSDYLVVICPEGVHEQTDEPVGKESYKARTWCRVEQIAHFSTHGLQTMWYTMYPGQLVALGEDWLQEVMQIFEGETTCCRLKHPDKRQCDRQLLVPSVLAMYTALLIRRKRGEGQLEDVRDICDQMNRDRDRTFPKTFMYDDSGRLSSRELFGSTIDRVYELVIESDNETLEKWLPSVISVVRPTGSLGSHQGGAPNRSFVVGAALSQTQQRPKAWMQWLRQETEEVGDFAQAARARRSIRTVSQKTRRDVIPSPAALRRNPLPVKDDIDCAPADEGVVSV
eukprot:TRINITY_DN16481_c0_g2_i1.p1 TRINITY_DN16481_c0_g2~~TRINITY_DN16481_c0_g2_i1.p1  ORF type:complete len:1025 (-),score=94.02 TRINITY_DN16481_c0_g2_i1:126-3200(-)